MKQFKIVVEKHPDTYVAYPLGMKGVVVGQGATYEAALADVTSAIHFHIETFGAEAMEVDPPIKARLYEPSSPSREYLEKIFGCLLQVIQRSSCCLPLFLKLPSQRSVLPARPC